MPKLNINLPSKNEIQEGAKNLMSYGRIFYFYIAVAVVCFILSILTTIRVIPFVVSIIAFAIVFISLFFIRNRFPDDHKEEDPET